MNVFELPVSTSRPVLSAELSSSQKRINVDLLGTGRVSSILHVIRSLRSVTSWIWSWLGWLENFACRATSPSGCRVTSPSGRRATSEPNSLFHSCFNEIFGGGRGDMFTFSFRTSPVFSLTTFGIQ